MSDEAGGQPDADVDEATLAERFRQLRTLDWGRLSKKLTVKARRWGLSPTQAEDLAQDAVAHVVKNRGRSWDPEADPSCLRHLIYVLDWKRDALLKREASRQEKMAIESDSEKVDEVPRSSDPGVEGGVIADEAVTRNLRRLRASLRDAPVTLALLELCVREGQLDPSVCAERLGFDVKQIYTAEAQLRRHVKRLREEGSDPDLRLAKHTPEQTA